MKALIVLSGGQDSTTCAAFACEAYGAGRVAAVTFNYGQRHAIELDAARNVALLLGIKNHEVVDIGPILKSTSPLTDDTAALEQYSDFKTMDEVIGTRIEKTFVPMRNALFFTLAANRAVVLGCSEIWTGVCEADNANYPDCRREFVQAQEGAINQALGNTWLKKEGGWIDIVAPLMSLSKQQSIRQMLACGMRNLRGGVSSAFPLLAFTHTAYDGKYPPTGQDHASVLRAQGFLEARMPDPLVLRAVMEGAMELPKTINYADIGSSELIPNISNMKDQLRLLTSCVSEA